MGLGWAVKALCKNPASLLCLFWLQDLWRTGCRPPARRPPCIAESRQMPKLHRDQKDLRISPQLFTHLIWSHSSPHLFLPSPCNPIQVSIMILFFFKTFPVDSPSALPTPLVSFPPSFRIMRIYFQQSWFPILQKWYYIWFTPAALYIFPSLCVWCTPLHVHTIYANTNNAWCASYSA